MNLASLGINNNYYTIKNEDHDDDDDDADNDQNQPI